MVQVITKAEMGKRLKWKLSTFINGVVAEKKRRECESEIIDLKGR